MSSLDRAIRRIARHRVYLCRDTARDFIPRQARIDLERCYTQLLRVLERARVECEAAAIEQRDPGPFGARFAAACERLSSELVGCTDRERDIARILHRTGETRARAEQLLQLLENSLRPAV